MAVIDKLFDNPRRFEGVAWRYLMDGSVSPHYIENPEERTRPSKKTLDYYVQMIVRFYVDEAGRANGRRISRQFHQIAHSFIIKFVSEFPDEFDIHRMQAAEVLSAKAGRDYK